MAVLSSGMPGKPHHAKDVGYLVGHFAFLRPVLIRSSMRDPGDANFRIHICSMRLQV